MYWQGKPSFLHRNLSKMEVVKMGIKRGGIFLADLGESIGSVQRGERPVLVVKNNKGNK